MRPRLRRAVIRTNLILLVVVAATCAWIGPLDYLLVQWPVAWLAGSAGIFLFYVQHHFEDAYWKNADAWTFADAAIKGSSYLRLPASGSSQATSATTTSTTSARASRTTTYVQLTMRPEGPEHGRRRGHGPIDASDDRGLADSRRG